MQKHLAESKKLFSTADRASAEARWHISCIETGLTTLDPNLDSLVKPVPPSARKPKFADQPAQEVFAIPELFEQILQNLDVMTLLNARQVNHEWFDVIQSSIALQGKLCLIPDSDLKFYMPFPVRDSSIPRMLFSVEPSSFYDHTLGESKSVS